MRLHGPAARSLHCAGCTGTLMAVTPCVTGLRHLPPLRRDVSRFFFPAQDAAIQPSPARAASLNTGTRSLRRLRAAALVFPLRAPQAVWGPDDAAKELGKTSQITTGEHQHVTAERQHRSKRI